MVLLSIFLIRDNIVRILLFLDADQNVYNKEGNNNR